MPITTESVITFQGEGSDKIYKWAQEGSGGVFFARVFVHHYRKATDEDWSKWENVYQSYRLSQMSCDAVKKGDEVILYLNTIRLIPIGVFKKIADTFPEIHAEVRFIQQCEEFFGNIVIENGEFLWTMFHNSGKRSKNQNFEFMQFFNDDYEKDDKVDDTQREVLKFLQFDRNSLKALAAKNKTAEVSEYVYNYPEFYYSEDEIKAVMGDPASQFRLAQNLMCFPYGYFDSNPEIYNVNDEIEREVFFVDLYLMGESWLTKAVLSGYSNAVALC